MGRDLLSLRQDAGHEDRRGIVRHDQAEVPGCRRGNKRRFIPCDGFGAEDDVANLLLNAYGVGREHHLVADSDEKFVRKKLAEPAERCARRGLAEMNSLAGAGDALFCEEGIENDEEVQIQAGELHDSVCLARMMRPRKGGWIDTADAAGETFVFELMLSGCGRLLLLNALRVHYAVNSVNTEAIYETYRERSCWAKSLVCRPFPDSRGWVLLSRSMAASESGSMCECRRWTSAGIGLIPKVHGCDKTGVDREYMENFAVRQNIPLKALDDLAHSDADLASHSLDDCERFDMGIELAPLSSPVGADLFLSDNFAPLRSLGPAHILRHQC